MSMEDEFVKNEAKILIEESTRKVAEEEEEEETLTRDMVANLVEAQFQAALMKLDTMQERATLASGDQFYAANDVSPNCEAKESTSTTLLSASKTE